NIFIKDQVSYGFLLRFTEIFTDQSFVFLEFFFGKKLLTGFFHLGKFFAAFLFGSIGLGYGITFVIGKFLYFSGYFFIFSFTFVFANGFFAYFFGKAYLCFTLYFNSFVGKFYGFCHFFFGHFQHLSFHHSYRI